MKIRELIKKKYIELIILFFIFLSDRITKLYIIHLGDVSNASDLFSSKFLNIQLIWNNGVAFGLFSFDENKLYNILTALILLVITVIIFMIKNSKGLKRYSLLMILGGALGNVFDRIFYKAVPDFIDFHVANFHWFIFNVADIFITMGVIFMVLLEFIDTKREKKL